MKNPVMEAALESMFPGRGTGVCVMCKSTKTKESDFKDDLSRKEYGLTYMCQECQDDFYGDAE